MWKMYLFFNILNQEWAIFLVMVKRFTNDIKKDFMEGSYTRNSNFYNPVYPLTNINTLNTTPLINDKWTWSEMFKKWEVLILNLVFYQLNNIDCKHIN